MMTQLGLPYPPSDNGLYFNRRRGGRAKTPKYEAWIAKADEMMRMQYRNKHAGTVSVNIFVGIPDKRKRDVGNLGKAIQDLLVRWSVIIDDSLIRALYLVKSERMKDAYVIINDIQDRDIKLPEGV